MILECIYTGVGRQRAVFLGSKFDRGRFSLEVMEGDEAEVDISFDPEPHLKKGRGNWQPFEGGLGGSLDGLTALRVRVVRVQGWVKLTIQGGADGTCE